MRNFGTDIELAIAVAQMAGKIIYEDFVNTPVHIRQKKDATPITDTDLKVGQAVVRMLLEKSSYNIRSEEMNFFDNNSDYCWVIDEIDGTYNYGRKNPCFVFMIGLLCKGKPIFGLIYDALLGRMYVGQKGLGCFKNRAAHKPSRPIHNAFEGLDIAVPCWGNASHDFGALSDALRKKKAMTPNIYSVGYGTLLLLEGSNHIVLYEGSKVTDAVAIHALTESVDGTVLDLHENVPDYENNRVEGLILAGPTVSHSLLEAVLQLIRETVTISPLAEL